MEASGNSLFSTYRPPPISSLPWIMGTGKFAILFGGGTAIAPAGELSQEQGAEKCDQLHCPDMINVIMMVFGRRRPDGRVNGPEDCGHVKRHRAVFSIRDSGVHGPFLRSAVIAVVSAPAPICSTTTLSTTACCRPGRNGAGLRFTADLQVALQP